MTFLAMLLQVAGLGATAQTVDEPIAIPTTAPTFADEFSGDRLDRGAWRYDTEFNRRGWHNNELQYYAAERPRNVRVENGALVVEARRERLRERPDWGGQRYSSGKIVSRRALGYGTYQIRAKLPCARGTWPAIWMLPDSGQWPQMGEIDIMEMVGWDANVVHATLHTGDFNHKLGTQRGAQVTVPDSCQVFHDYQLEWRPDHIAIGLDGRAFMRVDNDRPGDRGAWPFDRPFQLILNLAIGGDWGGKEGVDDAALPQSMTIDHVRFWAFEGDEPSP